MNQLVQFLKDHVLPDLRPGYVRDFHASLRAAIADGKLTEEEIAALEKQREDLGIDKDAFDLVKQELYMEAFRTVAEDAHVTEDEWDELEQIQDYLGLTDEDISKTKKELYRMRILSEIKNGNLPVADLPAVLLKQDEIAHWSEPVDLLMPGKDAKKSDFHGVTLHLPLGLTYRVGLESASTVKEWVTKDRGDLIVTSGRIVYIGKKKTIELPFSRITHVRPYVSGIRIDGKKEEPLLLRYRTDGNQSLVASILLSAIDLSKR